MTSRNNRINQMSPGGVLLPSDAQKQAAQQQVMNLIIQTRLGIAAGLLPGLLNGSIYDEWVDCCIDRSLEIADELMRRSGHPALVKPETPSETPSQPQGDQTPGGNGGGV